MEIEKVAELRKQLIDAQEATVVVFRESEQELKLLVTEGSRFVNNGIHTDTEMNEASAIVAKITKKSKEIEEQRKGVTRILDSVKDSWIERQKELLSESLELKKNIDQMNSKYLTDKNRKIQEAKDKIKLEADIKLETSMLPAKISNCYQRALTSELSDINQKMSMSWARLTLDVFDERIAILKNFKPKVTYEKMLSYFNIEVKYLKPEDVSGMVRKTVNYEVFCKEFSIVFEKIKQSFVDRIEEKRAELKTQSEAQRMALEEKAQQELIEKKAQELLSQKQADQELSQKESTTSIQIEMESQAKIGSLDEVGGRSKWRAFLTGKVDWNKIIEPYAEEQGLDKLEFLFTWLCKNGRPEIPGIVYEQEKKVVNRL